MTEEHKAEYSREHQGYIYRGFVMYRIYDEYYLFSIKTVDESDLPLDLKITATAFEILRKHIDKYLDDKENETSR